MRRALVTGGSGGIGAATARALGAAGHHVIVQAHRNLNRAERVASEIREAGGSAEAVALDLTDPACAEAVADLATPDPVHILVHAAGGQRDMPFAAMEPDDWAHVLDLNLTSVFAALRPLIMPMMRARWGRIVFLSSLAAVAGNRGQTSYAAAKGALLPLAKSLTRELASRGITANVVAPGLIETPETRALANWDDLVKICPMRRAGTPEEVAALIRFVVSEEAAYLSGQSISLDGGSS